MLAVDRLLLLLSLVSGSMMSDYSILSTKPSLAQWLDSVLEDETIRLRPVQEFRKPVQVTLDFRVLSIVGINEKQEQLFIYILYGQFWQDQRLSWDPALHRGILRVALPWKQLWVPNIILHEMVGFEVSPRTTWLSVSHLGSVELWQPRLLQSSCPLDLEQFPLDYHTCNLTFSLLTNTQEEVEVHWASHLEGSHRHWDSSFSQGEWEVMSVTMPPDHRPLWHLNTSSVRAQVTVRRRPLLYLVTLLLPSSLLLMLDLLAFLIPVYLKQRLNVKATIFTGHFVSIITIFSIFPPFTKRLPLIEVYLFSSLGLLACSTMETAVVFQLANGRNAWVSEHIFPVLSRLLGRKWRQEPHVTDVPEPVPGWGPPSPDGEQHSLGDLQRDLVQVRRNLQGIRQDQDRLIFNKELGTLVDQVYVYLHCMALLAGGVTLHVQWARDR